MQLFDELKVVFIATITGVTIATTMACLMNVDKASAR
jgi:hypothetical protein